MSKLKDMFQSGDKEKGSSGAGSKPSQKKSAPKVSKESKGQPDNHHKKWDKFKKGNE